MIAFAFLNASGIPTGGGIRAELPDGAVPLTAPFTTRDLSRLRFREGQWEERTDLPEVKPPSAGEIAARTAEVLARARTEASARVNDRAGRIRSRIYTDIPGQDALYLEKRAEAVAFVRETDQSGLPETLDDYPLLQNETGITAPTPWQLAQLWLNRSAQFKRVGAATERLRMTALIALAAAPDLAAVETIETDLAEALSRLPL
jgi:hypothetical protein